MDFSGLAKLYGLAYARASTEAELLSAITPMKGRLRRSTLLELALEPALKPVTASRHF